MQLPQLINNDVAQRLLELLRKRALEEALKKQIEEAQRKQAAAEAERRRLLLAAQGGDDIYAPMNQTIAFGPISEDWQSTDPIGERPGLPPESSEWGSEEIALYGQRYDLYLTEGTNDGFAIDIAPDRAAEILARADVVSHRAMNGETSFSMEEYAALFDAAEILTGVPADLMRAYAFGEGNGTYYAEQYPRQFLLPDEQATYGAGLPAYPQLDSRVSGANGWATLYIDGVQVPVSLGDDKLAGYGETIGLGVTQMTFPTQQILAAGIEVMRDGEFYEYDGLTGPPTVVGAPVDVERLIRDPYYNVLMFTQLILRKIDYHETNVPNAHVPGSASHPEFGELMAVWDELPGQDDDQYWAFWVGSQKGGAAEHEYYVPTLLGMRDDPWRTGYDWVHAGELD